MSKELKYNHMFLLVLRTGFEAMKTVKVRLIKTCNLKKKLIKLKTTFLAFGKTSQPCAMGLRIQTKLFALRAALAFVFHRSKPCRLHYILVYLPLITSNVYQEYIILGIRM